MSEINKIKKKIEEEKKEGKKTTPMKGVSDSMIQEKRKALGTEMKTTLNEIQKKERELQLLHKKLFEIQSQQKLLNELVNPTSIDKKKGVQKK